MYLNSFKLKRTCFAILWILEIKIIQTSFFKEIPSNKIALSGEKVVLQCSLSNQRNILFWSVERNDYSEIISRGLIISHSFQSSHEVNREVNSKKNIHYNLVIKRVELIDAGLYTCSDPSGFFDVTASLTVLSQLKCNSNLMTPSYSCSFINAGLYKTEENWSCEKNTKISSSRIDLKYSKFEPDERLINKYNIDKYQIDYKKSEKDNFAISVTYVKSKISFMKSLSNCSLKIENLKKDFYHIRNFNNQHPNFNIEILPVINVEMNVSQGQHIEPGTFIICFCKNFLEVDYEISIPKLNSSFRKNMIRLTKPGIYDIECAAKNGLSKEKVKFIVKNVKVINSSSSKVCTKTDASVCGNYVLKVFEKKLFEHFSKKQYNFFCKLYAQFETCLNQLNHCRNSLDLNFLILTYKHYCASGYIRSKPMSIPIELNYPHLLMRKYLFLDSLNPKNVISIELFENLTIFEKIVFSYCDRLHKTAYSFARESFARISKNEKTVTWSRILYSKLYGLDLEVFDRIRISGNDKEIILSNCSKLNRSDRKICQAFKYCLKIHTYMMRIYHYGFIYLENNETFLKDFCEIEESDLVMCENELVSLCEDTVQLLITPFRSIQSTLCKFTIASKFLHYQSTCFNKLEDERNPPYKCALKFDKKLYKIHDLERKNQEESICMEVKNFLKCIKKHAKNKCKDKMAAQIQLSLTRAIMAHGLKNFFCDGAFQRFDVTFDFLSHNTPLRSNNIMLKFITISVVKYFI